MTFGGHVRLAGAIVAIIGAILSMPMLSLVGFALVAVGAIWQIDGLERRMAEIEAKLAENGDGA